MLGIAANRLEELGTLGRSFNQMTRKLSEARLQLVQSDKMVSLGRLAAGLWGPAFPKYVLLLPLDAIAGFGIVMTICALASSVAIRAALAIDPAEAIGG